MQIAEVLDCGTSITWTTAPAAWTVVTGPGATHDGVDGLRTPPLGHGQSAELSGKIQGPGTLQGWSRVFSEPLQDILELLSYGVAVRNFELNASRNGALDTRLPRGAGLPVFEIRDNSQSSSGGCNLQCCYLRRTGGRGLQYAVWFTHDPAEPLFKAIRETPRGSRP